MTEQEKHLLLTILSAMLQYSVTVKASYKDGEGWKTEDKKLLGIYSDGQVYLGSVYTIIDKIKPYLYSIPNLTKEEQFQLGKLLGAASYNILKGDYSYLKELLEYVYKNHIDLFGLISMGLAIEASEGMYNT